MASQINIIHSSKNYKNGPSVLTIGNFDGVHIGHQKLIHRVVEIKKERNLRSCVFTFEPSPRSVLSPKTKPVRIANWVDKIVWLEEFGIENIILEPFSKAFAQHSAEWFIDEILVRRLQTQVLIVGYDFRFGRARSGTIEMIRQRAPNIEIYQYPPLLIEDIQNEYLEGNDYQDILQKIPSKTVVSSTLIRNVIMDGEMKLAQILLSRPHKIEGVVVSGMQRGRKIGFPTANIFSKTELIPSTGVYAVFVKIDTERKPLKAMANLGVQPTFNGHSFQVEVHIFDFNRNIYSSSVEIFFIRKLRSERKFSSSDELVEQLKIDKQKSIALLDQESLTF